MLLWFSRGFFVGGVLFAFESESHYVALAVLEPGDPPASVYQVLRSKTCTITPVKVATLNVTISETRRQIRSSSHHWLLSAQMVLTKATLPAFGIKSEQA